MPTQRPQGTLRYWNDTNNYGFIQLDGFPPRSHEVFVHLSALQQARLSPTVGMRLGFDIGPGLPSNNTKAKSHGKPRFVAINLTPVV